MFLRFRAITGPALKFAEPQTAMRYKGRMPMVSAKAALSAYAAAAAFRSEGSRQASTSAKIRRATASLARSLCVRATSTAAWGFRVYDLRHTFASLLLAQGAPITYVAAQLGHSRPTTTLQFYAHWVPGGRERFVDRITGPQTRRTERRGH